jgi:hypothetical protein
MFFTKHLRLTMVCLVALIGVGASWAVRAQSGAITLSLAVESGMKDALITASNSRLIEDFEIANPGVKVKVVETDFRAIPPAYFNSPGEYFHDLRRNAYTADVLYVRTFDMLTVEATRGGYFLDLASLTSGDRTFNRGTSIRRRWSPFVGTTGSGHCPLVSVL